jgi:hypothetical protein
MDNGNIQDMAELHYDILKHYGMVSTGRNGWKMEVNLVAWNGRQPKIDVRDWAPGHVQAGKGITLDTGEAGRLIDLLQQALDGDA